jgi:hypothetical protein
LKQVQVHTVHRLESHTDELFGQPSYVLIFADNLSVKIGTSQSPLAPEDNKHWLAVVASDLLALLVAVEPLDRAIDWFGGNVICSSYWYGTTYPCETEHPTQDEPGHSKPPQKRR